MMEKIRDAKLKAEQRLRDTLMGFYERNEAGGRQQEQFDAGRNIGSKEYWGKRGASLSRLFNNKRMDLDDEADEEQRPQNASPVNLNIKFEAEEGFAYKSNNETKRKRMKRAKSGGNLLNFQ